MNKIRVLKIIYQIFGLAPFTIIEKLSKKQELLIFKSSSTIFYVIFVLIAELILWYFYGNKKIYTSNIKTDKISVELIRVVDKIQKSIALC